MTSWFTLIGWTLIASALCSRHMATLQIHGLHGFWMIEWIKHLNVKRVLLRCISTEGYARQQVIPLPCTISNHWLVRITCSEKSKVLDISNLRNTRTVRTHTEAMNTQVSLCSLEFVSDVDRLSRLYPLDFCDRLKSLWDALLSVDYTVIPCKNN